MPSTLTFVARLAQAAVMDDAELNLRFCTRRVLQSAAPSPSSAMRTSPCMRSQDCMPLYCTTFLRSASSESWRLVIAALEPYMILMWFVPQRNGGKRHYQIAIEFFLPRRHCRLSRRFAAKAFDDCCKHTSSGSTRAEDNLRIVKAG